jgi:large subunit ribosomal protein L15
MLDRLAPRPGARKKRKRGRGAATAHGKTGGRGIKGQGTRSAGRPVPAWSEGGQMPMTRRLPKRGFHNPFRVSCQIVNTGALAAFGDGATVDVAALAARGLSRGDAAPVKLLAEGDAPRNLVVRVHRTSEAARRKIEAAGGTLQILA